MGEREANAPFDDLDAFLNAADSGDQEGLRLAAETLAKADNPAPDPGFESAPHPGASPLGRVDKDTADRPAAEEKHPRIEIPPESGKALEADADFSLEQLQKLVKPGKREAKFIALDPAALPGSESAKEPFVLIPANVHSFVPWWGWVAIVFGLFLTVLGIVLAPRIRLERLAGRLGDGDRVTVQQTMRQLVLNGDERTVGKLYDLASSPEEKLNTRLRAVDTMALIEKVPEVDRSLLRLELSAGTHEKVREAAIAARKQREAYKSRNRR